MAQTTPTPASSSTTLSLGQVLFKFRSFTPVPVLIALAWLLSRSRAETFGGAQLDALLDVAGVLVALAGQALRFYTLGQVPEGTSGQGNQLEAVTLNTRGPYAHVRNPLYVGNFGICAGLLLIANDPWVTLLALAFFFGEYFFIIRAEENFLRSRFGAQFDDFCARVPRWIPRFSPAYEGQLRQGFDLSRALKKEHNPFAAWALGAVILLAWESFARGELDLQRKVMLITTASLVTLSFALIKAYKRRWLFAAR